MSYDEKNYEKGITRVITGESTYIYYYIDTQQPVSAKDLDRIHHLHIPPAWTDVWISRDPQSSIQAIGKDSKGRKQYRYHHVHIVKAEKEKFTRLYAFIKKIPTLIKQLEADNQAPIYSKQRVISLMLQIVKDHHLRVGKEIYAKTNRSYGISSLRKKHVTIDSAAIKLKFKGKSKQRLHYTIRNPFYVNSIKLLMKLDGDNLFQYIDEDETVHKITDTDLNTYIRNHMGKQFSIKDFRTYGANLHFIKSLLNETQKRTPKDRKTIKKNLVNALKTTATQLKHTGAVSKKSYVMNFAIELYQNSPETFIKNKNMDPTKFLLGLLQMYKKHILE